MKKELAQRYEQLVQDYGVTCCHHTCGNLALQEYMQGVLPSPKPDPSQSSGSVSASSKSSKSSPSKHSSAGEKASSYNQTKPSGFGTKTAQKPEQSDSTEGDVKGFVMEAVNTKTSQPSSSAAPLLGIGLVLVVLFMIWTGFRRKS